eukprot:CAMPEP_0202393348 /NCGR_PEP_ID=MMETSP1127-20130417/92863_1 /ASSEMBLY_ACC=CAM_ASM_000462 /TAXON_ID=3047 /ORGANISM="Dunaliella tertiolecta, Strain CCMP1320" /LENGTH=71 /DNA_ID=CAMNT_0048995923 /DNA_START=961 /DNA_END=1173 /DNA_ORIENTATION=+
MGGMPVLSHAVPVLVLHWCAAQQQLLIWAGILQALHACTLTLRDLSRLRRGASSLLRWPRLLALHPAIHKS